MAINIVRFQQGDKSRWGVLKGNDIYPIDINCNTTAELLAYVEGKEQQLKECPVDPIALKLVSLISPVTESARVFCQGINYPEHMRESGMDPTQKTFNMFFIKTSASITGPTGEIIKPRHVKLLDYEIELALVLRKRTSGAVYVNQSNIHEYVAGICIGNDISARDVQLPQGQFYKGKSYRTFCPLGPTLCLLEKDEMHYLDTMNLKLTVNGSIRQQDSTSNTVFKPAETISEFSQIENFFPGDVILTGTPSGCAARAPSRIVVKMASLLPEAIKWRLFVKGQSKNPNYLNPGDIVESTIVSSDGMIDLGKQIHRVELENHK